MHQVTSSGFGFREAMEGYAAAGVRLVEPDLEKAREFDAREGSGRAGQLLCDLGLKAVSSSNQVLLEEPGETRKESLDALRWKVALAESLEIDRLVVPSLARGAHDAEVYGSVVENLREAAEVAAPHGVKLMLEFTHRSSLISNLRTAIKVKREVSHPNLGIMLDTFHFWAGRSKMEDLELLDFGELDHLHFQDVPAEPPVEVFEQRHRVFPGDGIAPLREILDTLLRKGYSGAASLELFDPSIQNTSPKEVAERARISMARLF